MGSSAQTLVWHTWETWTKIIQVFTHLWVLTCQIWSEASHQVPGASSCIGLQWLTFTLTTYWESYDFKRQKWNDLEEPRLFRKALIYWAGTVERPQFALSTTTELRFLRNNSPSPRLNRTQALDSLYLSEKAAVSWSYLKSLCTLFYYFLAVDRFVAF